MVVKTSAKNDPVKLVKEILAQTDCPQFILIESNDNVRRQRILKLILERFNVTDAGSRSKSAERRIDCTAALDDKLPAIQSEMASGSLFARTRFFIFNNAQECSAQQLRDLVEMIKDAPPDIKILISASILPTASVFRKFFSQSGTVVSLPDLAGFDLNRWIQKELKQQGVSSYAPEVVELIKSIAEEKPDAVVAVVEHLALYLDEAEKLTPSEVDEVFIHHKNPSEFVLLDELSKGLAWKVELVLSQLIRGGKNPFGLLALLAKSFSRHLAIAWLLEGDARPAEIRQQLGIAPWLFQKHLDTIKRYDVARLRGALFAILVADAKLKNLSLGTETIFSELSSRLSA